MKGAFFTKEEMIDYLIDCTLATVEHMVISNYRKGEFQRQCSIAQVGINFLGADYPFSSRASKFVQSETAFSYYTKKRELYLAEKNKKETV